MSIVPNFQWIRRMSSLSFAAVGSQFAQLDIMYNNFKAHYTNVRYILNTHFASINRSKYFLWSYVLYIFRLGFIPLRRLNVYKINVERGDPFVNIE